MIIEEYVQRMFHEYCELTQRVMQLNQYLNGLGQHRDIADEDYDAMQEQLLVMARYAEILGGRLTKYFNDLDYTI